MYKLLNDSKTNTILSHSLTQAGTKADLASLYSPGNLLVEHTEYCENRHGLKTSSEAAKKLLSAIGIEVSGDTVLRDIHRMSIPTHPEVQKIGVDDWAFKKGVRYGSIIVSLNTRAVIDLLGDRDIESFKGWLDDHTQVKIVSRDRSTDYTAAIGGSFLWAQKRDFP